MTSLLMVIFEKFLNMSEPLDIWLATVALCTFSKISVRNVDISKFRFVSFRIVTLYCPYIDVFFIY